MIDDGHEEPHRSEKKTTRFFQDLGEQVWPQVNTSSELREYSNKHHHLAKMLFKLPLGDQRGQMPGDTDRVLQPHHGTARAEKEGSCVGVAVNVEEPNHLWVTVNLSDQCRSRDLVK